MMLLIVRILSSVWGSYLSIPTPTSMPGPDDQPCAHTFAQLRNRAIRFHAPISYRLCHLV